MHRAYCSKMLVRAYCSKMLLPPDSMRPHRSCFPTHRGPPSGKEATDLALVVTGAQLLWHHAGLCAVSGWGRLADGCGVEAPRITTILPPTLPVTGTLGALAAALRGCGADARRSKATCPGAHAAHGGEPPTVAKPHGAIGITTLLH
mmetsp:Transcript_104025/g.291461  ORF Transcript_104025/g.291461 Transcript_104025/m.291461 type:complete len:147 (+) Transcript_104025:161-601(+)